MCALRAPDLLMAYMLTMSRRLNIYVCQTRSSIRSRISSRTSLRRGAGAGVCRGAIVEEEATEDMARGVGVVEAEGEVDEREARQSQNDEDSRI